MEEDDLRLAERCLARDAAALEAFDQLLRTEVRRAVSPLDTTHALVDEVTQAAREKLLVQERLRDYLGHGPLGAWLRAVSVRLALNLRRAARHEVPADVVPEPEDALADPDPELALLRARHRAAFKRAFEAALGTLTARDRTLLRLTTLDGLALASVGQMYGKDASTISRWLAGIRGTLLAQTRASLAAALKLSTGELDSVMRVADSQLELSIARLLQSSVQ